MSGDGEAASATGWEIVFELPAGEMVAAFEEALADEMAAVASFEIEGSPRWRVTAYSETEPDAAAVRARIAAAAHDAGIAPPPVRVARLGDVDWVAEVEKSLKPIPVGPYWIHGSHVKDAPPAGSIPIRIDAGLAFGTGNHETTRGCLVALERLWPGKEGPRNPLDVGTGSGLLAIAAALRYGVSVVASDIDPVAVRVARENAEINGVASLVRALACDGLDDPAIESGGPYDLVFANIVVNPLIALAPDIERALVPGPEGRVILSGILAPQRDSVAEAYEAVGLRVVDDVPLQEWVTLVLARVAKG
jgi:ribosomal protein L11 methyltransferase